MLEDAGCVMREPGGRRVAAGPRLTRLALDVLRQGPRAAPRHAILKALARGDRRDGQPDDARRQRCRLPRSRRVRVAAAHDAAARLARAAALHGERQAAARADAGGAPQAARRRVAAHAPHRRRRSSTRRALDARARCASAASVSPPTTRSISRGWRASPCRSRSPAGASCVRRRAGAGRADDARDRAAAPAGAASRGGRACDDDGGRVPAPGRSSVRGNNDYRYLELDVLGKPQCEGCHRVIKRLHCIGRAPRRRNARDERTRECTRAMSHSHREDT